MKNLLFLIILFFTLPFCKSTKTTSTLPDDEQSIAHEERLIGFNQNWRFLPPLNSQSLISNIKELKPQIIRYPGGTITHGWNWKTGTFSKPGKNDIVHPIEDLKKLIEATGAQAVFDLDVVNSSADDQIAMLNKAKSLGIEIKFLELGNELYSQIHGYETQFPDGNAYADTVNIWVPKLRKAFPNARIAALHIGKTSKIARQSTWNRETADRIRDIDAFTYHIYLSEGNTVEGRIADFQKAYYNPNNKPIWITEYGSMVSPDREDYLPNLSKLADYIEKLPGVTMVLNHTIIGSNLKHSKLDPTTKGATFTAEGKVYLDRVQHGHRN